MTKMDLSPKDTNLALVVAERDQLLKELTQLQTEYLDLREKTNVLMDASEKFKEEFMNLFSIMQNESNILQATLIQFMKSGGQKN